MASSDDLASLARTAVAGVSDALRSAGPRPRAIARVSLSLLVLWYLARQIPLEALAATIAGLSVGTVAFLSGLLVVEVLVSTASVYVLARYFTDVTFPETFALDSTNFIANTFIPSRFGSMISMPLLFDRYTKATKAEGAVIQTTQLVLTSLVTGVTAATGWFLVTDQLSVGIRLTLAACVLVYLGLPAAAVAGYYLADLEAVDCGVVGRIPLPEMEIRRGVRIDSRRLLMASGCLLVTRVLIAGVRLWVLSLAFGAEVGVLEAFFVPTLMYSVTVLPISFGGIGIAEASGTVVLSALGFPIEVAAALVVVDRTFVTYLPLLGFYCYVNLAGLPDRPPDQGARRT